MVINNIEFKLDLSDSKVLDNVRIEVEVFNRMVDKINQMDISCKEKVIRKRILLCVSLEGLFGKGADKKIFNDDVTASKCESVMKQFNREVKKQYANLKGIVIEFPLIEGGRGAIHGE